MNLFAACYSYLLENFSIFSISRRRDIEKKGVDELREGTIDVKKGNVGGREQEERSLEVERDRLLSRRISTEQCGIVSPTNPFIRTNDKSTASRKKIVHHKCPTVKLALPAVEGAANGASKERRRRSRIDAPAGEPSPVVAMFSRPAGSRRCERDGAGGRNVDIEKRRRDALYAAFFNRNTAGVLVCASPGARYRIYPTGSYSRGTLSPTSGALPSREAAPTECPALLRAARDGDDRLLVEILKAALRGESGPGGIEEIDLNAADSSGRTIFSYIASNGSIDILEQILHLPGLDPNKPDNEGNTPLHFAAQAGQIECLNCMLTRCRGLEIDARNNLGLTPLMKAALQGRNKCAKLLLFAGANPTLRDNGRGFRADQWARFCGRYVCADVIEKHARQKLLERSTSYGNWGGDGELAARVLMGKVVPMPVVPQQQSQGLKSKLRKVFRTSSSPAADNFSSARLVTQLTSAALCASSPVLPAAPAVPPVVKSLIRPLTVPRLQITLVNNNNNNNKPGKEAEAAERKEEPPPRPTPDKPVRFKKKK